MNDIEAAREKRKKRLDESRLDDVAVWLWVDEGKIRVSHLEMAVRDTSLTPVYTNRQRADLLFDALWVSTSDAPADDADNDRVCYTVYLDNNGRTWTRGSDKLIEGEVSWVHGKWLLKRAWDVAEPLLTYALLCTLKPYRYRWPLRRWKWLHSRYED